MILYYSDEGSRLMNIYNASKRFGFVCCMILQQDEIKIIEDIIEKYKEPTLKTLRILVDYEDVLFIMAKDNVKDRTGFRHSKITLLDVICCCENLALEMMRSIDYKYMINHSDELKKYKTDLYNEYIALGGNPAVIMYGLPEYMCLLDNPTGFNNRISMKTLKYLEGLTKPCRMSEYAEMYRIVATHAINDASKHDVQT